MRVMDLFSGIGGFALGLDMAGGFETVGFCEADPFCRLVLAKHWPTVPCWEDIRELDPDDVVRLIGRPDLVCGGFPCQDISCAGRGAGIDGARSSLWSHMARIIAGLRPRWVIAENVPALRLRGADRALGDLEALGYACAPFVVGAEHVGAPHKRHRVWIVAHAERIGRDRGPRVLGPAGRGEPADGSPKLADTDRERRQADGRPVVASNPEPKAFTPTPTYGCRTTWPARPGQEQQWWEAARLVEPRVGGPVDGVPVDVVQLVAARTGWSHARAARWYARYAESAQRRLALKAFGNSVVPKVVELIGRAIRHVDGDL